MKNLPTLVVRSFNQEQTIHSVFLKSCQTVSQELPLLVMSHGEDWEQGIDIYTGELSFGRNLRSYQTCLSKYSLGTAVWPSQKPENIIFEKGMDLFMQFKLLINSHS